jgi:hydroxyacylglutathione hydrolase
MKQWICSSGCRIFKITGGRSNVFLVSNDKVNILIDTGPAFMGRSLIRRLNRVLKGPLDFLLLTHTHFDHAANTFLVKEQFNPKIIVNKAEADFLLTGDSPVPAGTNIFTRFLVNRFGRFTQRIVRYHSCKTDIIIGDHYDLSRSGIEAYIMHTPGHSAGSVSLIIENEIAIVGDTLFGTYPGSCFPPFADDVEELMKSWELLLNTGCRLFLPSHGTSIKRSKLEFKFRKRKS